MIFIGIGQCGAQMLPDALLGDIIDYDELHTGHRSEGTYTIIETNLQQFVEIPSGTLPLVIFSLVGFTSNGNCDCGCGIKCANSFMRWHCTDPDTKQLDVGYACSGALGAPLLYGDPERAAPCTFQNAEVQTAIRIFTLLLPSVCFLICGVPLMKMKITNKQHENIRRGTIARHVEGKTAVRDPLTQEVLSAHTDLVLNVERSLTIEHFNERERRLAQSKGIKMLKHFIVAKVVFLTVTIGGILAAMAALGQGSTEVLVPAVTFGSLCL